MDQASRDCLENILRREGRSLFQYVREVPLWVNLHDQNALARLRELANAELRVTEDLALWMQRHGASPIAFGAFPDFTPYNDAALGYLLPLIVREQKQLLGELRTDRSAINDNEAASFLDKLIALKQSHISQLEALQPGRHTFTIATV